MLVLQNVVKPKPPAVPPPSELSETDLSLMNPRLVATSSSVDHFEGLADQIVLRIFGYLSARSLCKCSGVSRRFHTLAWQPQLWKTLLLDPSPSTTDSRLVALLSLICRASPEASVERVTINGCAAIADSGLRSVSVTCGGLRKLELRGCQRVTNAGLDEVLESCPALLHLDAAGTKDGVVLDVRVRCLSPCYVCFISDFAEVPSRGKTSP